MRRRKSFLAFLALFVLLCPAGFAYAKGKISLSSEVTAKKHGAAKDQAKIGRQKHVCKVTIGKQVKKMDVIVNGEKFELDVADTEAAKALARKLPMTINMKELNGNEKYHYLKSDLPMDGNVTGQINTGDVMLYGSDCLVFFYKDFQTAYSYTRIGKISDPEGFADALGAKDARVTMRAR